MITFQEFTKEFPDFEIIGFTHKYVQINDKLEKLKEYIMKDKNNNTIRVYVDNNSERIYSYEVNDKNYTDTDFKK